MKFSNRCMSTYGETWLDPPSTQYTLAASSIQQVHSPGEYTPQHPFSFKQYHSYQNLIGSLLTHSFPLQKLNTKLTERDTTMKELQRGLTMLTRGMVPTWDNAMAIAIIIQPVPPLGSHIPLLKFDQPWPIAKITQSTPTRPYCALCDCTAEHGIGFIYGTHENHGWAVWGM